MTNGVSARGGDDVWKRARKWWKSPQPHKRITLDVKSGVFRWFEAHEKSRQIAKVLEIALEVFGTMWGAGRGREEVYRLPGSLVLYTTKDSFAS